MYKTVWNCKHEDRKSANNVKISQTLPKFKCQEVNIFKLSIVVQKSKNIIFTYEAKQYQEAKCVSLCLLMLYKSKLLNKILRMKHSFWQSNEKIWFVLKSNRIKFTLWLCVKDSHCPLKLVIFNGVVQSL